MTELALASDFPAATREGWEALVAKVLKGAEFERKLVSRTHDGLRIEPLYPKAEDAPPLLRGPARPWRVVARVDHPEAGEASALALADLQGGADALAILHAGAPSARGFGLARTDVDEVDRSLAGVLLDLVAIRVEAAPFDGGGAAKALLGLAEQRGHPPASLDIDFGLDPIGDLARTGRLPVPWTDLATSFAETASWLTEAGYGGATARIDTRAYHEAGAGEVQELAAALATGVAYLRALEAGGMALEEARRTISFLLVADADEFLTVAKFRAMRRLWTRVEAACGLDPAPISLHAETAWRMTTRRDPWVNVLRGTLAAFSAGIAGADSVAALPFTAALGLPDAFARRLARNTQIVLLEEANLWRVADPVAGSGAFEALTDALAEAAWAGFGEIEREGGIVRSLVDGGLGGRIAAVRAGRERAVATRRDPLTGTSEFPDLREAPVHVLRPMPPAADLPPPADASPDWTELPSIRLAEPFERLRDASDAVLARTGSRPRAFLACLGSLATFTARSTFARNAFEACGIEALADEAVGSPGDLARAFATSGATAACLCSSDEVYEAEAEPAAAALRAAGASPLYLAGRPGPHEARWRQAGIDGFLYAGCDLPNLVKETLSTSATSNPNRG